MEIKRCKNSFKIEQMVLILSINFLLFSSVKNIWECPKVSCGKFYGNLFGCLLFERFKNEEFFNKRRHSWFENLSFVIWLVLLNGFSTWSAWSIQVMYSLYAPYNPTRTEAPFVSCVPLGML